MQSLNGEQNVQREGNLGGDTYWLPTGEREGMEEAGSWEPRRPPWLWGGDGDPTSWIMEEIGLRYGSEQERKPSLASMPGLSHAAAPSLLSSLARIVPFSSARVRES